jgi:hypothetical protein
VEKEVRHPARHDEDHADARDHEGEEESDESEPREMADRAWGSVMLSRQLFLQFAPVHPSARIMDRPPVAIRIFAAVILSLPKDL